MTSPYYPTGNSISERINQTISRVLQTNKGEKVTKIRQMISKAINWGYQRCLGYSPYELTYLRNPFNKRIWYSEDIIKDATTLNQQLNRVADQKRRHSEREYKYSIGDSVYYKEQVRINKLDKIWTGPYVIRSQKDPLNSLRSKTTR